MPLVFVTTRNQFLDKKSAVFCFIILFRLMASLIPPLPSALTSILSTLLPCGFAVGPSRFCEGRLGLWWVGCVLKPGSLLGRDGGLRSSLVHQSERMKSEATVCCDSETTLTGCTEETKASKKISTFLYISLCH